MTIAPAPPRIATAPHDDRQTVSRRQLLTLAAGSWAGVVALAKHTPAAPTARKLPSRLMFTSGGRTGLIHADGSGLRYLKFDVPGQASWQPGGFFSDGQQVLMMSMEPRRDGPGKPFDEYYHQTPTHLWTYHVASGKLTEIATQNRQAPFYAPQLLLGDDRLLVQIVRRGGAHIVSMNLDGSDQREFTRASDGFPYGLSLSPDRRRVAFHLATSTGYQIWVSDVDGGRRVKVAAKGELLYFAPQWSPDGEWLLFQACLHGQDPGHDWSDVCISRPDGSDLRTLTTGQAMWFAASYGNRRQRGGGSNVPQWTPDGAVLFPRKLPGSKVPWEYQSQRPDTDHFNREYKPESARGGTEICRLDPRTGAVTPLTRSEPPTWDFRATPSPDGRLVAFCRAPLGEQPSLWVMDADGGNSRKLSTTDPDARAATPEAEPSGVDHPRWLPHGK